MDALLLTAGLGSRLDPITRLVAKPAVPLGDRTLVERAIDWIRRQGVADLVLNLHARPASLTTIVGDGRHLGVRVRYSWEQPILGSAGGPRHALPLLDSDPFLIVNGDTLCDVDVTAMADAHRASGADVTLAVVPNPDPAHYNGVVADERRRVTGFVPGGRADGSWHFVGVQIASKQTFAGLRDGEPAETIAGIYRDMVRAGRVAIWPVSTTFLDIGTPRHYIDAARRLGGTVETATVTRSIVWPDARVADGAVLDRCVVAGPVQVPAGFAAQSAVLVPASLVTPRDAAVVRDGVAVFPL